MNRNHGPNGDALDATAAASLKRLSIGDWARFGAEEIAYIRPVVVNGVKAIAIHAADGEPMAVAADQELAVAAILQHEMVPALVH